MPRFKTIKVAALNIKTQPHSQHQYIKLFNDSYGIKDPNRIRSSDWGIIGSVHEDEGHDNVKILRGFIYRYLNIDPKAPWLNLENITPIDEKDPEKPPIIPNHLKPNLKTIPYIFYPSFHRFFFDSKNITPGDMKHLVSSVFKHDKILKNYGIVDVTIETTREAIAKILAIPRLTKLNIIFSRPNDDDLGPLEQRLIERIDQQRIRRLEQNATSTDPQGINADEETKAFMKIARSNGSVYAKGYAGDQKIEISTVDHPVIGLTSYNPDLETDYDALLETSQQMLPDIIRE